MANLAGFDANKVDPNKPLEHLPAGDYPVIIVKSEMKPTSNGDGQYLELEMQVVRGPHQNRKLYDRLNLINKSEKAVQIARGTLSAICRAVGVLTPNDSTELHYKELVAAVKVKMYEGNPGNEVKGYKSAGVGSFAAPQTPPAGGGYLGGAPTQPAAPPVTVGAGASPFG
jgi:hypothetical protein